MMKNSPVRITKRRKVALAAREKALVHWNKMKGQTDLDQKDVERKIALTESEIVILKKLVGFN